MRTVCVLAVVVGGVLATDEPAEESGRLSGPHTA